MVRARERELGKAQLPTWPIDAFSVRKKKKAQGKYLSEFMPVSFICEICRGGGGGSGGSAIARDAIGSPTIERSLTASVFPRYDRCPFCTTESHPLPHHKKKPFYFHHNNLICCCQLIPDVVLFSHPQSLAWSWVWCKGSRTQEVNSQSAIFFFLFLSSAMGFDVNPTPTHHSNSLFFSDVA